MTNAYGASSPGATPPPGGPNQGGSMLLTIGQNIVTAINALAQAFTNAFPQVTGSFTLAAAATTAVTQPAIRANSVVVLVPTNAAAATLMGGTKSLYVSALSPGTSFTVATASGVAAAGTETFSYAVVNPS